MKTERRQKERDAIIFDGEPKYYGGICHFRGMDYDTLRKLVDEGHADPEDRQNYAPSIGELLEALEMVEGVTFEGYTVHEDRPDYRVSVDGFTAPRDDSLVEQFHNSDELIFQDGTVRFWWD